jgi:hypothetical protein
MDEREKYTTDNFIKEFMNDHNGETPRWLRGIFTDEEEKIEVILFWMRKIEQNKQ